MQKIIITLPLYTIEIEADNERDLIKHAAFWQSLPTACPHCRTPLVLSYRTPQNNEYFELRCTGDKAVHSINLGQPKDDGKPLYFDYKKSWYTFQPGDAPDSRRDGPAATPDPAFPAQGDNSTEPARPSIADVAAAIIPKRNDLLKLIKDCKGRGIHSRINPADVAALDLDQLDQQIQRLGTLVLEGK
jgi:hypothetical protein